MRRDPLSVPMPFTGPWERDNPVLAGRVWQCLTKRFHEYEDLIKRSEVYCDSPIEASLLSALLTEDSAFYYEGEPILIAPGTTFEMPEPGDTPDSRFILAPQYRVGAYRIDIAAAYTWTGKRVAIECDGHDFHEKTKEQAGSDNSRNRALLAAGWPVMRFTGSQIHADPFACAAEIARFLAADEPYSPNMMIVGSRR